MWIRACSAKSLALLVALIVSFFVFVIAAGEARAEEQGVLPGTQWPQWCAAHPSVVPPDIAPSGTSPFDNPPAGSTANGTAPAPPFPPPHDSVPLPAPGIEEPPGQHALPYPGAGGGPETKPIPPNHSQPPEGPQKPTNGPSSDTEPRALP